MMETCFNYSKLSHLEFRYPLYLARNTPFIENFCHFQIAFLEKTGSVKEDGDEGFCSQSTSGSNDWPKSDVYEEFFKKWNFEARFQSGQSRASPSGGWGSKRSSGGYGSGSQDRANEESFKKSSQSRTVYSGARGYERSSREYEANCRGSSGGSSQDWSNVGYGGRSGGSSQDRSDPTEAKRWLRQAEADLDLALINR